MDYQSHEELYQEPCQDRGKVDTAQRNQGTQEPQYRFGDTDDHQKNLVTRTGSDPAHDDAGDDQPGIDLEDSHEESLDGHISTFPA